MSGRSTASGSPGVVFFVIGTAVGVVVTTIAITALAKQLRPKKQNNNKNDTDTDNAADKSNDSPQQQQHHHHHQAAFVSHGFLTELVAGLWPHLKVAMESILTDTLRESLASIETPLLASTLQVVRMDLGRVPVRIDNFVVHAAAVVPEDEDNHSSSGSLQVDCDIHWDSTCDIQLKADYVGRFGVKTIVLVGRLSFLLKPLTSAALPGFTAVSYTFINAPHLQLDFTGLAQVADLSLFDTAIRTMIQTTLASMLVLPQRRLFKLDPASFDFFRTYEPPKGILRLTLLSGRGFVAQPQRLHSITGGLDIPDVYCRCTLGGNPPWTSSTVDNHVAPVWEKGGESADFVLFDFDQILTINALDQDRLNSVVLLDNVNDDDLLGTAQLTAGALVSGGSNHPSVVEVELVIGGDDTELTQSSWPPPNKGRPTGAFLQIRGTLGLLTTWNMTSLDDAATTLTTTNDTDSDDENHICGMLIVLVSRAFNVPGKIQSQDEASSFVKVTYGGTGQTGSIGSRGEGGYTFATPTVVPGPGIDSRNPSYDAAFHISLTPVMLHRKNTPDYQGVVLELYSDDTIVASTMVTIDSVKNAPGCCITEQRNMGSTGAKLEFRISLYAVEQPSTPVNESYSSPTSQHVVLHSPPNATTNPMTMTNSVLGSDVARGAMGKVKVTIVQGRGFRVQKAKGLGLLRTADVPDVYAMVRFGSDPNEWRTSTVRDTVAPVWNESKVYPLTGHGQTINIDVWDEDKSRDDDYIGQCSLTVGSALSAGGTLEMALDNKGQSTGAFILVNCEHFIR